MGELLLRRALACRDRLEKVRRALPANPADVAADERLEAFVSFNIFLLLQDTIALATGLVAARGLGVPGSQREAFELLARAGVVTADTASGMATAAALRNRIAHTYGDVDPVRLVAEAPRGLDVVAQFLDEVTPALTS